MRARLWVFALVALLSATGPLVAGPAPSDRGETAEPSPGELAREGLETVLRALNQMLEELPVYGPPRLTPEGDIIIPRIRPEPDMPPGQDPERERRRPPEPGADRLWL